MNNIIEQLRKDLATRAAMIEELDNENCPVTDMTEAQAFLRGYEYVVKWLEQLEACDSQRNY